MSSKWKKLEKQFKEIINESKAIRKLDKWLKEWRIERKMNE